jgi:pimeloyl-ACP methyl ester carboxylesterase
MDGTGTLFAPFVAALGSEFAVRIVSYPPTGAQSYPELEQHARAALPRHGRFVVLGESFSGPVAVSMAACPPAGPAALILCSTFVRTPRPAFNPVRFLASALPVKSVPPDMLNVVLLGRFSTPDLRAALAHAMAQVSAPALRARLRAVLSVDVSDKLKTVGVPVLYLRATRDRVVPAGASSHIQRVLPATQVVAVEAPHFLLQAAPVQAAGIVSRFMRSLDNA